MRKLILPLLVLILASAAMMYSQNMPGILCSGGGIACLFPGSAPGTLRIVSAASSAVYAEITRQDTNGNTIFNNVAANTGWAFANAGVTYFSISGGLPGPNLQGVGGLNLGTNDSSPVKSTVNFSALGYLTITNCASSACTSSVAGATALPASATTVTITTSAVTANSNIIVTEDQSLGARLGVTCNTQSLLILGPPRVTARSTGASFTVGVDVAPTANPLCFNWHFVN